MALPAGPILALELSSAASSLALGLLRPDSASPPLLGERSFTGERGRSVIVEVAALLAAAGIRRRELGGILVGTGPGSYTGLRIACTAGRVLAAFLDIPVAGLCSFQALALHAPAGAEVHVLLDAYRQEVYHAAYRRAGSGVEVLTPPRVLPRRGAPAVPPGALLLGDPELAGVPVQVLEPHCRPRAADLLALARNLPGLWQEPPPVPLYLRAAAFRRRPPADA